MSFALARRPRVSRPFPKSASLAHRPPLRLHRGRPRNSLRASVGDAAGVSAMVAVGETYFAAFALALGAGETLAGLFATLPMLAGAALQLATPPFLRQIRSYKRWVVALASAQATALLLLPVAALAPSFKLAAVWLFATAACYWAAGQA